MKINLLLGEHKEALLDACLSQIAEHTDYWPDKRAFFIVPESLKADTERRYIENFGKGGLMMADILSFRRLAYRLFAEAGGLAVDYISTSGRTMLIQSLLRKNKKKFHKFAYLADKPGYAAEIDSVIGDFRRYNLLPADIISAADMIDNTALKQKLYDFSLLYELCEKNLKEKGLTDRDQDLIRLEALLADNPERLDFLNDTSIWIYGFGETRDFTEQEYSVLDRLINYCPSITITVCADTIPKDKKTVNKGSVVFRHGRYTAWHINNRYSPTINYIKSCRNDSFEQLAQMISRDKKVDKDLIENNIRLIRAQDKKEELSYVAGEIRRLLVEENYRYRDIAIAVCDLESYQYMLQTVFREYGLDSFIDVQSALSGTSLMRYVTGLMMMCRKRESFESLMSLLRTGLTEASFEQIDQFENYCLAFSLNKYNKYRLEKYYSAKNDDTKNILDFKRNFIDPLLDFCNDFNALDTVHKRCAFLVEYLTDKSGVLSHIEKRIENWVKRSEHHAASTLAQAWNTLIELMDEMALIFENQKMSVDTFTNILYSGISGSVSKIIPSGIDRIMTGDINQVHQISKKILFVVGAQQTTFPVSSFSEGLLRNNERESIETVSGKTFPNLGRQHLAAEAFKIYTLLTMPSEMIYISCPSLQDSSSVYQQRLHSLGINQRILKSDDSEIDMRWNSFVKAKRYLSILNQTFSEEGCNISLEKRSLIKAVLNNCSYDETDLKANAYEPMHPDSVDNISIDTLQVLERYPKQLMMSVSGIQKFRECPYAYFAYGLLELQERNLGRLDSRHSGTILHALAEAAFSDLTAKIQNLKESGIYDIKEAQNIYDKWCENINQKYVDNLYQKAILNSDLLLYNEPDIYASSGRRLRVMAVASLQAAASQINPLEYMPYVQEWQFPGEEAQPLRLVIKDRELIFRGVIDRVDIHADSQHSRILDYKSGRQKIDYDKIYHGLALQLPVYMHAWLKNHPELKANSLAYFRFDNPEIIKADHLAAPSADEIKKAIAAKDWLQESSRPDESMELVGKYAFAKVAESIEDIFDGKIGANPVCMSKESTLCEWCDYKSLCSYDNRTIGRRTRILEKIDLPADYPGIKEMNANQKKEERLIYIEKLMKEKIK